MVSVLLKKERDQFPDRNQRLQYNLYIQSFIAKTQVVYPQHSSILHPSDTAQGCLRKTR